MDADSTAVCVPATKPISMKKAHTYTVTLCAIGVALLGFAAYAQWDAAESRNIEVRALSPNEVLLQQKEAWRELFKQHEPQDVYGRIIEEITQRGTQTHTLMHMLGELLYEEYDMKGLGECDGSFGFGCYHGFFNAAIYAKGIEILPELDAACKEKYGSVDTRCQHGLGHGLLVYTGYENLLDALTWCTTISAKPTGGCTGGVFMEYNFHTMEEPSEDYYRPLGENMYLPCISLPEQFQASCFQEQPQWWARHLSNDYKRMGELCAELSVGTANSNACFQGIGNTITEQSRYAYDVVIKECNTMPHEHAQALCREGASWQFIGRGEEDRNAYILLCESLNAERRDACMSSIDAW